MPTFKNVSGYDLWVPSLVRTVKDGESVEGTDDFNPVDQPERWKDSTAKAQHSAAVEPKPSPAN